MKRAVNGFIVGFIAALFFAYHVVNAILMEMS